jgi:hypothetical protein
MPRIGDPSSHEVSVKHCVYTEGLRTRPLSRLERMREKGYSADGTIVWLDFPNAPKAAKASVSTFVIGHLVIQVVTVHHEPEHENARVERVAIKDGEWDKLLLTIWPVGTRPLAWPPQAIFSNKAPRSIATLQIDGEWAKTPPFRNTVLAEEMESAPTDKSKVRDYRTSQIALSGRSFLVKCA